MTAQMRRSHPDRDRIVFSELLRGCGDPGEEASLLVFVQVSRDLVRKRGVRDDARVTTDDRDVAAPAVAVEVERYFRIGTDISQLLSGAGCR